VLFLTFLVHGDWPIAERGGELIIEKSQFSLQKCITLTADIITPEVHCKGLHITLCFAKEVSYTHQRRSDMWYALQEFYCF
jgi:hypothetical protein